ncbi:MAG: hypothetical protein AAGM22_21895 [Acidobacteriota bacterium]
MHSPSRSLLITVALACTLGSSAAFAQEAKEETPKPQQASEDGEKKEAKPVDQDAPIAFGDVIEVEKKPQESEVELTPEQAVKKAAADKIARENSLKRQALRELKMNDPGPACADGIILEDGKVDTGYGFVTSAVMGEYVQRFDSKLFPSRDITEVCVCWIRGSDVNHIDFEVVFYKDASGRPANSPYAVVEARSEGLPYKTVNSGRFYPAAIEGVTIPEGASFIGVRYNPSENPKIYICADQGPETAKVPGFQREDRAKGWDNLLNTKDWIFSQHRALSIRAVGAKPAEGEATADVPGEDGAEAAAGGDAR